jgi:hypothetical protein
MFLSGQSAGRRLALGASLCVLAACQAGGRSPAAPDGNLDTLRGHPTIVDGAIAETDLGQRADIPPGRYLIDPATAGGEACTALTLETVLGVIRGGHPELADITTIYNPARQLVGDGSFVYPYQRSDGGFSVAFKRGLGDCPSGCTDNYFYYFATDQGCSARQVGHYHARLTGGTCLEVDGAPLWGHPPAPDPQSLCVAEGAIHN